MVRILSGIKGTKKAAPKKLVPMSKAKNKPYKVEKEVKRVGVNWQWISGRPYTEKKQFYGKRK